MIGNYDQVGKKIELFLAIGMAINFMGCGNERGGLEGYS